MCDERIALNAADRLEGDRGNFAPAGGGRQAMARRAGRPALAKLAKAFALALFLIAGVSAPGWAAAAPPATFIRMLGSQVLAVMRSNATTGQKVAYFHEMLFKDFDLPAMSRFVLGPYWRLASPIEQQEFYSLFANHLIHIFGQRLAESGGGAFVVTGSRSIPDGVTVTAWIVRAQAPAIELDWRLAIRDGFYKIEDVAIDGVSMALAQRSEFARMITRQGGQLGPLLAMMRKAY